MNIVDQLVVISEIGGLTGDSVKVAEKAGALLEKMVPDISRTAELVQEITASSEEQSTGVGQITSAMRQLDTVTQQNAAGSEELAATAEEMQAQSENLQQVVSFFKLAADDQLMTARASSSSVSKPAETTAAMDDADDAAWVSVDDLKSMNVNPRTLELLFKQYGFE